MYRFRSHRPLLWLLLAVALAYLPGALCQRGFWVADETRYAGVLREMVSGGHWIVPYLPVALPDNPSNGIYYPDKPPLYFWGSALASIVLGRDVTPFAALLVTWLSALGWVLVTWRLGQRIVGDRAAFTGALLMIPAVLSLLCAQMVRMDMTLAWLTAWALLLFLRAAETGAGGRFAGFYLLTALAMLTKGPLGLAFTLLPAVGVLIQRRAGATARRLLLSPGWLIVVALVGGWLASAWALGERDYLRNIFGTQLAGRALRSGFHNEPVYFYLLALPALLLPWTGLFPRALADAWQRRKERGWDLLVWWFLAGLITISLVRGKLFIYVLPLLPPLFLALGDAVTRWTAAPAADTPPPRPTRFECGIGPAVIFLCLALLPLVPLAWPWTARLFLMPADIVTTANATLALAANLPLFPVGLTAVIAGTFALISVRRRLMLQALWTTGVGIVLVSAWFHLAIAPRADIFLSGRALAGTVNLLQRDSRIEVATAGVQRGIFAFYADNRLVEIEPDSLPDYLAAAPSRAVILPAARYAAHPEWQSAAPRVLATNFVADRDYLLVTRAEQ